MSLVVFYPKKAKQQILFVLFFSPVLTTTTSSKQFVLKGLFAFRVLYVVEMQLA
jgi:hypothetical protein